MAGWTMDKTRALVALWSQEKIQSEFDLVARNRMVYKRIAKELAEMGYEDVSTVRNKNKKP